MIKIGVESSQQKYSACQGFIKIDIKDNKHSLTWQQATIFHKSECSYNFFFYSEFKILPWHVVFKDPSTIQEFDANVYF